MLKSCFFTKNLTIETEAKQQQQWAKQVAEVVCDCLNQAQTHHLQGSQHTAHWSKGDCAERTGGANR